MKALYWRMVFFVMLPLGLSGQTIKINEVLPSNSVHQDEDGDTPDWFELHNTSANAINLQNWTCSDDLENIQKWTFPNLIIAADAYLRVWASDKDRNGERNYRTLVSEGDIAQYLVPNQNVGNEWVNLSFDDSAWSEGPLGIGYGDGDDNTIINSNISVFLRKTFMLTNAADVASLILDIDYDDSFIAYVNGQEIARANISGLFPAYDVTAFTDREAQMYNGGLPERFTIENIEGLLQDGENVLSIQVHNVSPGSSDMSIIPFLTGVFTAPSNDGINPPDILDLDIEQALHTNFKLSSAGETLYLFDDNSLLVDSIQIPELPENISVGIPYGQPNAIHYFDLLTPEAQNPEEGYLGVSSNDIIFSHPGGLTEPISLSLSGIEAPGVIRYTLDATPPTESSPIYTNAINISSNTVVRARAFQENFLPSFAQTRSYILDASHDLPVVCIAFDPPDFFDEDTGMYAYGDSYESSFPYFGANFWEDWERPIHLSIYEEDGSLGAAFNAGAKIFGGWSRGNDQRSLSIFARNQYGVGIFDYPFFPDLSYDTFEAIVLRNSGNDWNNTMMRDAVLTGLLKGADIEFQAYRPVATYFNESYWGIYNIREKINEHFLASKWGVDPDEIDLLEANGSIIYGDNTDYLTLLNFISTANLADDGNYNMVASQMDLDNFALYQATQIYFDNRDWPGNNIKFGRHHSGKWRWIVFDTDFGFGPWNEFSYLSNTLEFALEPNGPGWPNPPWATLFLRRLTQSTKFRNLFVNRFADELNSRFLPEKVNERIDSVAAKISSEISDHFERWGESSSNWMGQVNGMRNFANQRPFWVKSHILSEFDLPAYHQITIEIDNLEEGYVQVNSLTIDDVNEWQGDYFEDVPITVTAVGRPGYVFSHWLSSGGVLNDQVLTIDMQADLALMPVFQFLGTPEIVINEINYKSADDFDPGDWVELYNPYASSIDLSNWILKDDDDSHSFLFPQGTIIPASGFLILSRDMVDFSSYFPNVASVIGDFDFGLSSDGDGVRLYNAEEILIDEVFYLAEAPWPSLAAGEGYTLELIEPNLDNSIPENWAEINLYGSPGRANVLVDTDTQTKLGFEVFAFPNPSSNQVNFSITLEESAFVDIQLFTQNGQFLQQLFNNNLEQGTHMVLKSIEQLPKGLYFAKVIIGNEESQVIKLVRI